MVNYSCSNCQKIFTQKGHYDKHLQRKRPCKKDNTIEKLVEEKVKEVLLEKIDIVKNEKEILEITTKQVRKEGLDKFYTIPSISEKCINIVGYKYDWNSWDIVIEPSAGNGSFLNKLPTEKCIGIDIAPEHNNIIKQDFLTYTPKTEFKNILVIGNPPFGKVSSLAVKFFNHSSEWASVIAFIIPRTFRKISVQNRLNSNFHLIYDEDIPSEPCSFSPPMLVKCCFQIWERQIQKRNIIELMTKHEDWDFLPFGPLDKHKQPTPPKGADFAVRAYGGKCGEIIKTGLECLRPKSWHWIKSKINIEVLIERFESLNYSSSKDTARQNSIGRGEFVKLYSDKYD
jgi:predicted RNA methylase